jgi:hypothetical protein
VQSVQKLLWQEAINNHIIYPNLWTEIPQSDGFVQGSRQEGVDDWGHVKVYQSIDLSILIYLTILWPEIPQSDGLVQGST